MNSSYTQPINDTIKREQLMIDNIENDDINSISP